MTATLKVAEDPLRQAAIGMPWHRGLAFAYQEREGYFGGAGEVRAHHEGWAQQVSAKIQS
jgi:hypothetical protein